MPALAFPLLAVPENVLYLGTLSRIRDRLGVASFNYNCIGRGSSRTVFDLGDMVLKVPHNGSGLVQNKLEANPQFKTYYTTLLAEVLAADSKGRWLLQRKVCTVTDREFTDFMEQSAGERFRKQVSTFARVYGLQRSDLTYFENVGRSGDKLLICDFGLIDRYKDWNFWKAVA